MRAANVWPIWMPLPFGVWHALAWLGEMVPGAPITRNQAELMQVDTVVSPDVPALLIFGSCRAR